ncbi:NADH-quinone oxidoreductase subunit C [Ornithinimicrobium sp. Arc0846-15]|nr:NADH-quinone oxidoreductase subunit C [Ornithinimicrobium laminariae]
MTDHDWPDLVARSGAHEVSVPLAQWAESVRAAKESGFDFFDWLSAVDQNDDEEASGYDLVVHLIASGDNSVRPLARLLLSTRVATGESVESLTALFRGAAWHERETHEMFGIDFSGFSDELGAGLRPLLLPDGFEGTPLAKSFVLAARASKPWPGAKEPGEGGPQNPDAPAKKPTRRRKVLPPGVPDPSWGPR